MGATVAIAATVVGAGFVGRAVTAGPGGWDHLGDGGTAGTKSLNGNVTALNSDTPGRLLVGGAFTDAGGNPAADHIAAWDGATWSPVGSAGDQITGGVFALAVDGTKVYAGGTFLNAGGNPDADFLAVWDGASWAPFCTSTLGGQPSFGGNVKALEIVGTTLYVGGDFQDGAGIASADYLLACDLKTGTSSSTVADPAHPFSGPVLALATDSNGVLYAGGRFLNLENVPAADNVVARSGSSWLPLGSGAGACQCALDGFVRSLVTVGTDVVVGTDVKDVAGIAQADNVARWNGSAWSAVGSNAAGTDGWFPTTAYVYGLAALDGKLYASGSFQDTGGDPTADNVATFDGSTWHPVGSDGAGNGPWIGEGNALTIFDPAGTSPTALVAGGNFTSAGGDTLARSVASYPLGAPAPAPTPTVTPTPVPTPVPTPTPTPAPDTSPPSVTGLRLSRATFRAATSGAAFRAANAPVGTTVTFTLSETASVRFSVDRARSGRSAGGRCVALSKSNRGRQHCRLWVPEQLTFSVAGRRGANRLEFRGRSRSRRLAAGSYRLDARATDAAVNRSPIRRAAFRIVR